MRMKTDLKRYTCTILNRGIKLWVRGYADTVYPLTYTFEECVEHFCDVMDWELNLATQEQGCPTNLVTGIISFQRPRYHDED